LAEELALGVFPVPARICLFPAASHLVVPSRVLGPSTSQDVPFLHRHQADKNPEFDSRGSLEALSADERAVTIGTSALVLMSVVAGISYFWRRDRLSLKDLLFEDTSRTR
jgi:hypothetical protein